MANQQKNTGNKRRKYRLLLKGEVVKELSGFLDTLIAVGILKYAEAKADFGMDYVTIRNVQQKEDAASAATLDKLVWVVAYYIEVYRRKVEAEPESLEKKQKQKLHDILDLEKDFERIFGCKALYVLNLAKDGIDLRQIVKE